MSNLLYQKSCCGGHEELQGLKFRVFACADHDSTREARGVSTPILPTGTPMYYYLRNSVHGKQISKPGMITWETKFRKNK